jgi:hypothetical protein
MKRYCVLCGVWYDTSTVHECIRPVSFEDLESLRRDVFQRFDDIDCSIRDILNTLNKVSSLGLCAPVGSVDSDSFDQEVYRPVGGRLPPVEKMDSDSFESYAQGLVGGE